MLFIPLLSLFTSSLMNVAEILGLSVSFYERLLLPPNSIALSGLSYSLRNYIFFIEEVFLFNARKTRIKKKSIQAADGTTTTATTATNKTRKIKLS